MKDIEPSPSPVRTPPQPKNPTRSRRVGAIFQMWASGLVPSSLFAPAMRSNLSLAPVTLGAGLVLTERRRERQRHTPTMMKVCEVLTDIEAVPSLGKLSPRPSRLLAEPVATLLASHACVT